MTLAFIILGWNASSTTRIECTVKILPYKAYGMYNNLILQFVLHYLYVAII